jgi:hypothetical protein
LFAKTLTAALLKAFTYLIAGACIPFESILVGFLDSTAELFPALFIDRITVTLEPYGFADHFADSIRDREAHSLKGGSRTLLGGGVDACADV